ncbi:MAG: endolytic transglycosylase MltG [Thermoanaerobaculales bacterium]|jgi:UPF0755 protein|nr:endolytic transglycosylase MltG [Thermoanaerobaculales bacterium]
MRWTVTLLLVLVVAGVAVGGAAAWGWRQLHGNELTEAVEVNIPPGLAGRQVLELLHEEGLLPSLAMGRLYLRFAADGRSIRWGSYRFPAGSRPVDMLERLLDGRVEMISVTITEGSDLSAVATQMAAAGIGTEADWIAMGDRTDFIADLMPRAPSLEGFFFPETYHFAEGVSVETVARHLVARFRAVWAEESSAAAPLWGEDFDVVILASLVEAETGVAAERARVAGVYRNRLRRGMLLQCDPTVVYALKQRGEWTGRLLRVHWGVDDVYNTYRHPGLPPGPINSPSRAALRAAMTPEEHRYLYFVAAPEGGHAFSRTLAEHNRAVARWQRSRR